MEGGKLMTMVFVMNLLLAVVLTRNVNCEENGGGRENRVRGRSLRHITEYVREVEGVEGDGDLGVSRAYQVTPDEEAAKEQIVLNRIREAFLSYRDRQSLETKRQEEDETRKNTLPIPTDSPTDLEENRSPPTSTLKGAIERPAPQNREEPPHIRNLIERHTEQRRRERQERSPSVDSVNVNKILQFAQTATKAGFGQRNDDACFFERPVGAEHYRLTSAAFCVYIHGCKRRRVQHNSVLVYRVPPRAIDQLDSREDEDKELLATETITGSHVSAWHRFDVTTMVQNWMSAGSAVDADWIVLKVEFSDFDQEVVYPMDTGDQEHLPYLEMNIEPKLISRRRRSTFSSDSEMEDADYLADGSSSATAEEECSEATEHCCRRSLKVDFQSVGLRWIISPRSLHVSYCDGQCSTTPTGTRLMTPGLAAAIADRKTAGLCCAPIEFADLDVVYYDENMHVIFGTLRNFNVVGCGCL